MSRRSLADQVAEALVDLILDEGLQQGCALPPTQVLSERFDVSRTVVREALAALTGQGILSRGQGRECVVATPGHADLTRLLQFRIRHDAVGHAEILQCRIALEVTAAASAAQRCSPEAASELQDRLDSLVAASSERAFHEADIALHRSIAQASGNALLVLILDALVDFLHEVRVQATRGRRARGLTREPVLEEHRGIVQAVIARDPARAAQAMTDHLRHTAAMVDPAP